ncbi:MAG: electron transport complex subunit RsxE, partial [Gammaproteobacteria bacterium]|nr:electron transport complex subunit RsxE [Gammaproteobacteria bacterium]
MNLFVDSALRRNPAWVQLLGLCPLLAVTNTVSNAIGLSLASGIVLIGASVCVAFIRKLIPHEIRLPCFVLVIATFTTVVMMLMQAFAFDLYVRLALFI